MANQLPNLNKAIADARRFGGLGDSAPRDSVSAPRARWTAVVIRAWIICLLAAAVGHDFVGGAVFERTFAWLLAVPMVIVVPLLAFTAFWLAFGLLLGRR